MSCSYFGSEVFNLENRWHGRFNAATLKDECRIMFLARLDLRDAGKVHIFDFDKERLTLDIHQDTNERPTMASITSTENVAKLACATFPNFLSVIQTILVIAVSKMIGFFSDSSS